MYNQSMSNANLDNLFVRALGAFVVSASVLVLTSMAFVSLALAI